jgi:hypothetical protein
MCQLTLQFIDLRAHRIKLALRLLKLRLRSRHGIR